jgi:rfaE bifunctional protein kinase chain/domain
MNAMTNERLQEIIERMSRVRIGVIGDYFLDKYQEIDPDLEEISVETGRSAHQVVRKWSAPGAAGTVVNNLLGLRAGRLYACGVIGDDGDAHELRRGLSEVDTTALLSSSELFTPVYAKTMVKGRKGLAAELDRYDTKNRQPIPEALQDELVASIDRIWPELDAIILADQVEAEDCGVLTTRVRNHIISRADAEPAKIIWADSRRRIGLFKNITIKPNEAECVRAMQEVEGATTPDESFDDDEVRRCATALRERLGSNLCVTRGKRGAQVFDGEQVVEIPGIQVPEPTDPTGAGDSVMAGAVLAQASGATISESVLIGMLVGSITVQVLGATGFAKPEQLEERLSLWREQNPAADILRA